MDSSQVAKITEVAAMQASVPPPLSSASTVIYTSNSPLVSPGPPTLSPQIAAGSPRSVTMSTSSTKQMTKPDMAPPILTPPVRKTEMPAMEEAANQLPTSVQKHERLAAVQKPVNPPQIPKHIQQMMVKPPVINEPIQVATQQSMNKPQLANPGVYIPIQPTQFVPQPVPYLHSPEAYPSLQQISPNSFQPNQPTYPPVLSPRYHPQPSPSSYPGHPGSSPIPLAGPYQPTQQPEYPQGYPVQYSYPSQPPPAHHNPLTHRGSQIQQRPPATITPPTNITQTNSIPTDPMPTNITPTNSKPTNPIPTNITPTNSTPRNVTPPSITTRNITPTNAEQHMQQSPNQEAQIPSNQPDVSEPVQAATVSNSKQPTRCL